MKKSKRYIANLEQIDKNKVYSIEEAIKLAKAIADNGGAVKEGIDKEEAEKIKAQFEEAGATVELQ